MAYDIHKSIFGKTEVRFPCPHCQQTVINPLTEAGRMQVCPSCGQPHRVPGEFEKEQAEKEATRSRDAAEKRRESERHRQEELAKAAQPPPPRLSDKPPSQLTGTKADESYASLLALSDIYSVVGVIFGLLSATGVLIGLIVAFGPESNGDRAAIGLMLMVAALFGGTICTVSLLAIGDALRLIMDVAKTLHQIRDRLPNSQAPSGSVNSPPGNSA